MLMMQVRDGSQQAPLTPLARGHTWRGYNGSAHVLVRSFYWPCGSLVDGVKERQPTCSSTLQLRNAFSGASL